MHYIKNIVVIGAGYVGLVVSACFAEMGHPVVCLDISQEKVAALKKGHVPIYEPGLEELIKRNIQANRLIFTTDYEAAISSAHVCFFAVDTPLGANGLCDKTHVTQAYRTVAKYMKQYIVLVNKSTVPPGTAEFLEQEVKQVLRAEKREVEFDIVSNPEFLKEGSAVSDFMKPDRVVLGVKSERALAIMKDVYRPFMLSHDRLISMDIQSAEVAKYAANAMLACRISFMNSLSEYCEKIGANILDVRKGIGSDSRIGYHFLWAGVGYGGSCFPKDVLALQGSFIEHGVDPKMISAIHSINEYQKNRFAYKVIEYFETRGGIAGKTIGILGIAFKPDTDDIREAPAIVLINTLLQHKASVRIYDPMAMGHMQVHYASHSECVFCQNEEQVAEGASALVLVTEWKQFRFLDFGKLGRTMKHRVFFDGRNQYRSSDLTEFDFNYIGIGQKSEIIG